MKQPKRPLEDNEPTIESIEDVVESFVPGLSQIEYENIRNKALEKAKTIRHSWVAKGRGVLVCTSCEFPHRAFIESDKILVGVDENGNPILKDASLTLQTLPQD